MRGLWEEGWPSSMQRLQGHALLRPRSPSGPSRKAHDCLSDRSKKSRCHEKEERKLRTSGAGHGWSDPFKECIGNFWAALGTRDYMRYRLAMVQGMTNMNSRESSEAQLQQYMDMLRLCRSDNVGVRDNVPGTMLRLNKDQECYDFIKFWATIDEDHDDDDWGDMMPPYLDIKHADVFETPDKFLADHGPIGHLVPLILLKIKLSLDLSVLERRVSKSAGGTVVPPDVLDEISPVIKANRALMEGVSRPAKMQNLKLQIDALWKQIDKNNAHFWPALMDPYQHLQAWPPYFSMGSLEEAQKVLQDNYDVWAETPGVLDLVKVKMSENLSAH